MRGGVAFFCGLFKRILLSRSLRHALLPVSEFWATKSENNLLPSAKYNPGLHVEKTAFASANLPFFSREPSGILLDGSCDPLRFSPVQSGPSRRKKGLPQVQNLPFFSREPSRILLVRSFSFWNAFFMETGKQAGPKRRRK
jgi:hypothetical protein